MQLQYLGENNRYEVQEPIGRGSIFMIYRGRDTVLQREVAIKVLRDPYSRDAKFVTRFQRVARAMMALRHPNIVEFYDYGQTAGNYFIVMELIEGTDLRRYQRSRGVLDTGRAIIIAHDVAMGLGAMHRQGIVHRAISPRNVLVGRDGSIKLTGLSFASISLHDENDDMAGPSLGAINYYAPEVAQGEMVSPAADVYALGAVMYELLTGRTPFDGDTPVAVAMQHIQDAPVPPSQYNPGIPSDVEKIILRCMEKVPERRFADGIELARALELV
jgi:serine/threonine protein kinase